MGITSDPQMQIIQRFALFHAFCLNIIIIQREECSTGKPENSFKIGTRLETMTV